MNTNDSNRNVLSDVIELGVASVETQGAGFEPGETMGRNVAIGISEE